MLPALLIGRESRLPTFSHHKRYELVCNVGLKNVRMLELRNNMPARQGWQSGSNKHACHLMNFFCLS